MKRILHAKQDVKSKRAKVEELLALSLDDVGREAKLLFISELVPLGIFCAKGLLEEDVRKLAGEKYERGKDYYRWNKQWGSIYVGKQKVPMRYQRVRDKQGRETKLEAYEQLKKPRELNEKLLMKVFHGLSCRRYRECCELIPQVFGLSAGTVSNRFKEATEQKLKEFMERRLDGYEIVAIVIDGKTFQEDEMIIALGITTDGKKVLLGFIQAGTENASVCRDFLWSLLERGLKIEEGVLCVIDGSKGLRRAVEDVFGKKALVQRCQWHKRKNVVSYLPKRSQDYFRKALQRAYEKPTYEEAKSALDEIKSELLVVNEFAVRSLEEGLEETLTLHRLGLFEELGKSLKTTNCIESVMSVVEEKVGKVDWWMNSNQKQRWLATALLEIEPRLNRIRGYRYLSELRQALKRELMLAKSNAPEDGGEKFEEVRDRKEVVLV